MCGRFTQRFSWREIHELLDLTGPAANLRPRYNVAPGQEVAAVRADKGERRLSMLRWGLVPAWAKDPKIGYRAINARAETAREKPSFRAAWRARRCLIPADGFYEWARRGKGKQPWLFQPASGGVFAFAGLWERWTVRAGAPLPASLAAFGPGDALETCTILTAPANALVARVHHRMPVILPPDARDPWLAGEAVELGPYPADAMTAHPVTALVNKAANDEPGCVEPVEGVSIP
ncbi:MAG: SOS response-associated peptidase [Defluviicoccus sp.]|nr:SOS response-associated peptidase [Defluviicoccus sp.]